MSPISVTITDDNALLRRGVTDILRRSERVEVVGEFSNGQELVDFLDANQHCDVAILDVRMPVLDGVLAVEQVNGRTNVVMASSSGEPHVVANALQKGAIGYLVHGDFEPLDLEDFLVRASHGETVLSRQAASSLTTAIQDRSGLSETPQRKFRLSPREAEVIELVSKGYSNTDIATSLFISPKTVKNHINSLFSKLGAKHRAEAVAIWLGTAS